jgi:isopentenyl-diphosphate delta-isomerase
MTEPDQDQVVLVDDTGQAVGAMGKTEAHTAPGTRHLAFSVVITNTRGQMLLQRRHPDKPTFGDHWANACCSHPRPGEGVIRAARRRVAEELGVQLIDPREVGRFVYEATDESTGLVEHELDVVITGVISGKLEPHETEIAELRWVSRAELETTGLTLAPWLPRVLEVVGWGS